MPKTGVKQADASSPPTALQPFRLDALTILVVALVAFASHVYRQDREVQSATDVVAVPIAALLTRI